MPLSKETSPKPTENDLDCFTLAIREGNLPELKGICTQKNPQAFKALIDLFRSEYNYDILIYLLAHYPNKEIIAFFLNLKNQNGKRLININEIGPHNQHPAAFLFDNQNITPAERLDILKILLDVKDDHNRPIIDFSTHNGTMSLLSLLVNREDIDCIDYLITFSNRHELALNINQVSNNETVLDFAKQERYINYRRNSKIIALLKSFGAQTYQELLHQNNSFENTKNSPSTTTNILSTTFPSSKTFTNTGTTTHQSIITSNTTLTTETYNTSNTLSTTCTSASLILQSTYITSSPVLTTKSHKNLKTTNVNDASIRTTLDQFSVKFSENQALVTCIAFMRKFYKVPLEYTHRTNPQRIETLNRLTALVSNFCSNMCKDLNSNDSQKEQILISYFGEFFGQIKILTEKVKNDHKKNSKSRFLFFLQPSSRLAKALNTLLLEANEHITENVYKPNVSLKFKK